MKKAQNIIEISAILMLVVVVSLVVWPMINNQKIKLANLTKVNLSAQTQMDNVRLDALDTAALLGLTISPNTPTEEVLELIKEAIADKAKAVALGEGVVLPNNSSYSAVIAAANDAVATSSTVAEDVKKQLAMVNDLNSKYTNLSNTLASLTNDVDTGGVSGNECLNASECENGGDPSAYIPIYPDSNSNSTSATSPTLSEMLSKQAETASKAGADASRAASQQTPTTTTAYAASSVSKSTSFVSVANNTKTTTPTSATSKVDATGSLANSDFESSTNAVKLNDK